MERKEKRIALVLLGGKGERFSQETPKQFIPFLGVPLFLYPVFALDNSEEIDEIHFVAKSGTIEKVEAILKEFGIKKAKSIVEGGDTRQHSSLNGLENLAKLGVKDDDIVLIQDGDRPNLNEELIKESIDRAIDVGASIVAIPSSDSIFLSDGGGKVSRYVPRNTVYRAQTPQTFRFGLILKAHREHKGLTFTDDANLVKECGNEVAIVAGSEDNFKINTKEDGTMFTEFLERRGKR